jgi:Transient receptor potential (TRP) ion channel
VNGTSGADSFVDAHIKTHRSITSQPSLFTTSRADLLLTAKGRMNELLATSYVETGKAIHESAWGEAASEPQVDVHIAVDVGFRIRWGVLYEVYDPRRSYFGVIWLGVLFIQAFCVGVLFQWRSVQLGLSITSLGGLFVVTFVLLPWRKTWRNVLGLGVILLSVLVRLLCLVSNISAFLQLHLLGPVAELLHRRRRRRKRDCRSCVDHSYGDRCSVLRSVPGRRVLVRLGTRCSGYEDGSCRYLASMRVPSRAHGG